MLQSSPFYLDQDNTVKILHRVRTSSPEVSNFIKVKFQDELDDYKRKLKELEEENEKNKAAAESLSVKVTL